MVCDFRSCQTVLCDRAEFGFRWLGLSSAVEALARRESGYLTRAEGSGEGLIFPGKEEGRRILQRYKE